MKKFLKNIWKTLCCVFFVIFGLFLCLIAAIPVIVLSALVALVILIFVILILIFSLIDSLKNNPQNRRMMIKLWQWDYLKTGA